ncbi:hypothetical protein AGDE_15179 [Angomonas deanei]|nr:hypothetical protein AGDE_15179 [Angomonas deanei]|eukprot:EPY19571.1 hypothetical protein AGDE_15179 [Angomonas deanei]
MVMYSQVCQEVEKSSDNVKDLTVCCDGLKDRIAELERDRAFLRAKYKDVEFQRRVTENRLNAEKENRDISMKDRVATAKEPLKDQYMYTRMAMKQLNLA